ncbi:hypothetical protein BGZ68_001932 [Mortierella alpina]|nr:hypothetical protein BGZ68_001932 [Mortierella alpina]
MCFNGHIWQEITKHRVISDISDTCETILETLLKHIRPSKNADKEEEKTIKKQRSQLAKGLAYIKKQSNLNNIHELYKSLYTDEILETRLDQNPHILVVRNGVINLQTGELREGLPSDYMSRQLDVQYQGLDSKTNVIEDFIGDLFNHDQSSMDYLQRLLGYGITGCTDAQIWAIFTGAGSNDVTDAAMMRRTIVVPFNNIYTSPDDPKRPYNSNNPHHRMRDPEMKARLLKENVREQLLIWLVRGAVAWYKDKDLSRQPPAVLQAYKAYNDENDKLQLFIDEYCEIDNLSHVNASKFRDAYCKSMQVSVLQTKLKDQMAEKGYKHAVPRINGKQEKVYSGLRLRDN